MKRRLISQLLSHIVLIITSLFALFPIYFILWTSFSRIQLASLSASILPDVNTLTFSNYIAILKYSHFSLWLENSLIFGLSSAVIGISLAAFTGYGLSRFNFPGRRKIATEAEAQKRLLLIRSIVRLSWDLEPKTEI